MKSKIASVVFAVAAVLVGHVSEVRAQNATVSTNVFAESTVQYAAGTLTTSFTNYVSGYNKVKYSLTAPAKSYFKFDFTGQNPNTNYLLKFSFPFANNNGNTHVLLYALNQSYTAFVTNKPSLTWSNAQANFTGTNEALFDAMLTSGTFSATQLGDFVDAGGNSGSMGASIAVPWGQYLFNNQIVVVLTATNDPANVNGNGARLALNSATATFQPLTVGTRPPSITSIANQTVQSTTSSSAIAFTVSDPVDAAASLNNITVSLGNTNVTLTTTNITAGSGGNRTLTFTPVSNLAAGQTANVTVTVVVTDSSGNSASTSFTLTVPPFISLPVVLSGTNVNYIAPTNRIGAGSVTIPFQVVDTNVAASSLIVTCAISAYSTNLGSVSFTSTTGIAPNTNNCMLTINATGSGVGVVNVTVIDPVNAVTNTLPVALMVLPDASYAACDNMNYQPSTSYSSSSGHADLTPASANLWAARSTSGSVNLLTSTASGGITGGWPTVRGSSSGNSDQLRLVGAPYAASSHKVLFASINAQWADLSAYGASAFYPGNSTGGFVEFAADGNTTGVAMAAVCTVTNSLNTTNNDGSFYLGLYNGTNAASVNTSLSQAIPNFNTSGVLPNSPVNIVISYDTDTGISKMWLNQSDSTGASVSLQDVAVTNLANVSYLVLRQNANMGSILIQNAAVKVVTKPVPTMTGITQTGANTYQIKFTSATGSGGTASVVGASTVNGTYNTVSSTISESPSGSGNFTATVTGSGSQMFYKIAQSGGTPTVTFPF